MAALKVAQDCRWVNAQRRVTVTLAIEQAQVNYPTDTGAGSIMGMAVYKDGIYHPMRSSVLPVYTDTDQELAEGGDALTAVLDLPRFYEQRDHIYLWPRSDAEYPLRIEYMAPMNLPLDTSVSLTDAQLIVYMCASMISKQMENAEGAAYYAELYADRLGSLKAWQNASTSFALCTEADLNENEDCFIEVPHWNRQPTPPAD